MSSDHENVRSLLRALTPQVQGCTEQLSSEDVENVLYGLRSMRSDHDEALSLLRALTPPVQGCTNQLRAWEVGNALYGLQGMSSDNDEMRLLLHAFTLQVQGCTEPLSAEDVSNALSGLQSMSSDNAGVPSLLLALTPLVQGCTNQLSSEEVGIALSGLQGLVFHLFTPFNFPRSLFFSLWVSFCHWVTYTTFCVLRLNDWWNGTYQVKESSFKFEAIFCASNDKWIFINSFNFLHENPQQFWNKMSP